jgi:calcium/calmodulin-dependent protein kinase (CaM kinase) II
MHTETEAELLELTSRLLEAIRDGDWRTYESLCLPDLTCFEPESRGMLVEGLRFHKYYFDLQRAGERPSETILAANVRMLGDEAAVVGYVRLVQLTEPDGRPATWRFEETRVWQRTESGWKLAHFHRSASV